MDSILRISRNLGMQQNVSLRVLDAVTGHVVQEHCGHNSATNSMLLGIAHHLVGDQWLTESYENSSHPLLSNYIPQYISLGTMGLINQNQDSRGLPAGIGVTIPDINDSNYRTLVSNMTNAKSQLAEAQAALGDDCIHHPACTACENCTTCSDRIRAKKQAVDDAQTAYDAAYDAVMTYSEGTRFKQYMATRPGYGADGYDMNQNNGRKYAGLGYAFTSYDVSSQYFADDVVSYRGYLYTCTQDTPYPAGPFNESYWSKQDDSLQPSKSSMTNLELISPSFPRASISFRDIVPEYQAELPKTIDVVFSAMISTGALKQFRPEGQDYIYITEAGLWSKRTWGNSGENGLLAAYRIGPPNEKNWMMTSSDVRAYMQDHPDFSLPSGYTDVTYAAYNRRLLKQNVIRVGKNQVVQVIWKIQLGSIDEFTDVAKLRHEYFGFY